MRQVKLANNTGWWLTWGRRTGPRTCRSSPSETPGEEGEVGGSGHGRQGWVGGCLHLYLQAKRSTSSAFHYDVRINQLCCTSCLPHPLPGQSGTGVLFTAIEELPPSCCSCDAPPTMPLPNISWVLLRSVYTRNSHNSQATPTTHHALQWCQTFLNSLSTTCTRKQGAGSRVGMSLRRVATNMCTLPTR